MEEEAAVAPAETPPDRLSLEKDSPFYDRAQLARGIGVRFKGVEKTNVQEYCVSEGWVRVIAGSTTRPTKTRTGKKLTVKLQGVVEPYYRRSA